MGVWVGTYGYDAKTATQSNACEKYYLYPNPGFNDPLNVAGGYGQWRNLDNDQCGDVLKGEPTHMVLQDPDGTDKILIVNCSDLTASGPTGVLQLSTCLSWDNNAVTTCSGAASAVPGTGSKCRCESVPVGQIVIPGDLKIAVSGPKCFTQGQSLTFTVTVSNPAAGSVSNINYTTALVAGDNSVPVLPSPTTSGCPTSLAGGASATCTVTFNAPADSSLTLTVSATGRTQGSSANLAATASVSAGSPSIASWTSFDPTCAGSCNGNITVAAAGAAPLSYLWNTGATTTQLRNLCAGTYRVNVTDVYGCTASKTFTLTAPGALSVSASSTNASCSSRSDGTATAVPNGGTAPYKFLWNNGATTASISSLAAGTYSVTVTDSKGCTASASTTVGSPSQLSVATIPHAATCGGASNGYATASVSGGTAPYTYQWSDGQTGVTASGLASGVYTVTVTDAAGCTASAPASIGSPTALQVATVGETATTLCPGSAEATATAVAMGGSGPYSYLWSNGQTTATATGLAAGNYTVTVTDSKSCVATTTTVVIQPKELTVHISSPTSASCSTVADATATASASGATPPYTYLWDNGQTTVTATGLSAGTHTVIVTDSHNCSASETITISAPPQLSVSLSSTVASCNAADGTATATPSGGTGPFTYLWSNGQTHAQATGLTAGSYSVTVTDSKFCTATGSVVVGSASCVCTLTQGYWGTHHPGSVHPAADPTWTLCQCYTSKLYNCPQTWQWYLDSPAKGSAITISAKQYIAAYLNMLKSGLDPTMASSWSFNTAVGDCFFTLKNFYSGSCSVSGRMAPVRSWKQRTTSADLLQCGSLLDSFNNGFTVGAPHC